MGKRCENFYQKDRKNVWWENDIHATKKTPQTKCQVKVLYVHIFIYPYISVYTYTYTYTDTCIHIHAYTLSYTYTYTYTDYLSTECEVCTRKHLPEVFVQTERRRSEVSGEKTEGKYFPVQTEQTRLIRNLLYGFWLLFSSPLTKLSVRELAVKIYLLVFTGYIVGFGMYSFSFLLKIIVENV